MDIYAALRNDQIPLTEGLIDIADTCTRCGICNKQCHFVTGLRPLAVMRALKDDVAALKKSGRPVQEPVADSLLDALQAIDPVAGMDMLQVKAQVGDRLCLCGNVDCGLLVMGAPEWAQCTVDMPLKPNGDRRHRTIVCTGDRIDEGKPALTE